MNPYHSIIRPADVSEEQIRALVHTFYDKVRADLELGPVFDNVIEGSWPDHLAKMCDFWSSLIRGTGRYKGNPLSMHMRIDAIRPQHFKMWLGLFHETAHELFGDEIAPVFTMRADRIAATFQANMSARHTREESPRRE